MSLRDNPLGELRVPLTWTAGIVFIVVLIASVAILLSDRREAFDTDASGNPRTMTDKVMAPVGDALSTPGRLTGQGVDGRVVGDDGRVLSTLDASAGTPTEVGR